ncbi:MAG: hypothetical protein WDZ35_00355 [Crocinitomicaceae bacterium]
MKNALIVFGVLIMAHTVYLINVTTIWYSGKPELIEAHWMDSSQMLWMMRSAFFLYPLHLILTIYAVMKKKLLWSNAIPIYFLPYMFGAIIQALIL